MRRKNPEVIASTFIPGTQLLRPTIDCVFKRMMQNNPAAIQSLLTAVLQPRSPIESVKVLNPELHGPRFSSKGSRLDLHVQLHNGTLIDIELQTRRDAHFIKRSLYYTFQMIGGELKKGEGYNNLPNLAGIYIFDETVFPELPEIHSSFQLRRDIPDDGVHLQRDILRFDFIELRKISSLNPKKNPLFSSWVQFLGAKSAEDLQRAANTAPELNTLVTELKLMSSEKSYVKLIQKNKMDRIIAQRAQAEEMSDARKAAMAEGKAEGRAEGKAEGRAEGKAEGTRLALLNGIHIILSRKMNITRDSLSSRLSQHSLSELESLLAVALDFTSPADLEAWEKSNQTPNP
jgi:predicted transposase/invertase (TIGR01784 family)